MTITRLKRSSTPTNYLQNSPATITGPGSEVSEEEQEQIDYMWSRLMQNGAEIFFLEETTVPADEIDFEIANFFVWIYKRDGWTTFRPYWQILRVTWRNYKAMGLDLFFESIEGYRVEKT